MEDGLRLHSLPPIKLQHDHQREAFESRVDYDPGLRSESPIDLILAYRFVELLTPRPV